jgi:nicotinamidase-related amidase
MKLGSIVLVSFLALVGCGPASGAGSDDPGPGRRGSGGAGSGGQGSSNGGSLATGGDGAGGGESGAGGSETVGGSIGMVVIDVQETFVSYAANADIGAIIDREKSDFQLAAQTNLPFFITFEDSMQGDHALHAPLQPVLPPQAQKFIKTTFDATGQPNFREALKQSGLSHLVVMGSETDVCVMQTVLGLRKLGFTVLLQKDAAFTSEPNTSPAVRRMEQAGAIMVDAAQVAGFIADPSALPKGKDVPVVQMDPLHMGVVLNDFGDASVAASADPSSTQKSARLRELLMVAEWFERPVYVVNGGSTLPQSFASYYHGQLYPLTAVQADVSQLVFAGTDGSLADAITSTQGSHQVFVMEDALLALDSPDAQTTLLAPFYAAGIVPTTYKSFYYDMTKSVDPAGWPSQVWVQRFDPYFDMTSAPEDLPPMPPS